MVEAHDKKGPHEKKLEGYCCAAGMLYRTCAAKDQWVPQAAVTMMEVADMDYYVEFIAGRNKEKDTRIFPWC